MRLTAAGWSRNHGTTEIADVDLTKTKVEEGAFTFTFDKPAIGIDKNIHPSAAGQVKSVTLNCGATLRLGGAYHIRVTIDKHEIAKLFYLTHKPEIEGLAKALPIVRRI